MDAGDFSGLLWLGGRSLLTGVGLVNVSFSELWEVLGLQEGSSHPPSVWCLLPPISQNSGEACGLRRLFVPPAATEGPRYVPPLPRGAYPPPYRLHHRLQWPAAPRSLSQAAEEGRPPTIPAWFGKGKSLPATTDRNKLNYASGEERKEDALRPLQVSRSELANEIGSVLICFCSVGRSQLWQTILSHKPRKVVLSVSVMNVSSVVTAPEGDKDRLAVHRGPKISIIFPPPFLCAPSSPLLPKKRAPQRLPSAFLELAWLCRFGSFTPCI